MRSRRRRRRQRRRRRRRSRRRIDARAATSTADRSGPPGVTHLQVTHLRRSISPGASCNSDALPCRCQRKSQLAFFSGIFRPLSLSLPRDRILIIIDMISLRSQFFVPEAREKRALRQSSHLHWHE